jgi:hypothetical protein
VARTVVLVLACAALGVGLFALGRETAGTGEARREGRADGLREGLRTGRDAGVQEGRALQLSESAPRGARQAFEAGYAAGANDAFGGFDGGWAFGTPYVITLRKGGGAITYRIDSRRRARGTSPP